MAVAIIVLASPLIVALEFLLGHWDAGVWSENGNSTKGRTMFVGLIGAGTVSELVSLAITPQAFFPFLILLMGAWFWGGFYYFRSSRRERKSKTHLRLIMAGRVLFLRLQKGLDLWSDFKKGIALW